MDSHEPDFVVVGEKVALGPLRRDLAASYARWMNQLEVRRGLDQMGIATPESQEKWVEENIEKGAMRAPQVVEFTVYDRTDSAPVGTAGLLDIGHANGTAEFAIIIGERRGQGLGTGATRLVLDFAFHVLELRKRAARDVGVERRGADGLRARGLSPRRRPPRRGHESGPADGHRDHGRRPGGLRRVGAALTSQAAPTRLAPQCRGGRQGGAERPRHRDRPVHGQARV